MMDIEEGVGCALGGSLDFPSIWSFQFAQHARPTMSRSSSPFPGGGYPIGVIGNVDQERAADGR
jgi:hypothetical protein